MPVAQAEKDGQMNWRLQIALYNVKNKQLRAPPILLLWTAKGQDNNRNI